MAISIRVARISDAGDVAQLTAQLGYDVTEPTVARKLSRILHRDDQRFLIAECDGRSVGWIHALFSEYIEADAFVLIEGLVVDRSHRRHGVGTLLMERAEHWASEQGCSVVRLWSSSNRAAAHRFYEQLGYTNVKTACSFAKSVDQSAQIDFSKFVPRVD